MEAGRRAPHSVRSGRYRGPLSPRSRLPAFPPVAAPPPQP